MLDFAEFFAGTRHEVFRVIYAATGTRTDAEDAVAEAYARAYRCWESVAGHPNPIAWVLRTALNQHRSTWRHLRRELLARSPQAPLEAAIEDEHWVDAVVRDAVLALPRRQREAVALRVVADLSAQQAAALLGISPAAVTAHLSRALRRLRRELAPPEAQPPNGALTDGARTGEAVDDILDMSMRMAVRHAF